MNGIALSSSSMIAVSSATASAPEFDPKGRRNSAYTAVRQRVCLDQQYLKRHQPVERRARLLAPIRTGHRLAEHHRSTSTNRDQNLLSMTTYLHSRSGTRTRASSVPAAGRCDDESRPLDATFTAVAPIGRKTSQRPSRRPIHLWAARRSTARKTPSRQVPPATDRLRAARQPLAEAAIRSFVIARCGVRQAPSMPSRASSFVRRGRRRRRSLRRSRRARWCFCIRTPHP